MNALENPAPIPLAFIGLTSVAALFLGAGVVGLFAPDLLPPLASPAVAWSLLGVGIILDVGAVLQLLSSRKHDS